MMRSSRSSNSTTLNTSTTSLATNGVQNTTTNGTNSHAPILNNTPSHSKISSSQLKKSIYPVIQEAEFGESIRSRTLALQDFKDLGPVDLVHISTIHPSTKVKEIGQYHFINGLDVSSIDAPIAYLTSILLNFEKTSKKDLKIATYLSYNCFTKGDLRIRAEFPGNITTSFIYSDPTKVAISGDKINQDLWLETNVSAIIRSILFNSELTRILPGMVKLNPIQSKKMAMELIDKLCLLLPKGPLTGSRDTILTPSYQNNYLNDTLLKIVELTNSHQYAIDKIKSIDDETFQLLIIQMLFSANKEVEAVKLLYKGITKNPRDAFLLLEQSNYLISKARPDLALISSQNALNSMPTEFECWENLVQVYIILGNYKQALSTLNSAPMYSARKRDSVVFNLRDDLIFEQPFDGCIKDIWDEEIELIYGFQTPLDIATLAELQACDPVLIKIFNNSRLYGTFNKSYKLISNMVRIIGWDKMLNIRSKIFVMEDEMSEQENGNFFKDKTLCERWLDHLFLILYDDLRIVMIWENERIDNVIRHSALEWLLIGLASIRCHHYESGIAALKTTVNNKFNFFASWELIQIYKESQSAKFKALHNKTIYNGDLITLKLMNDEFILKQIVRHLSYEKRYYGEFNPDLILLLENFIKYKNNEIYLKSFIAGEFSQELRLFILTDRIIDWISMFIE